MYSQLRERIRLMRARLDNAAPVAEIRAESQLFVTPAPVCAKWHLNRSQFGIRIDHDLASISDHSLASQSITIWHA
ncbi:hypothetical protein NZ034_27680, partial [Escherichia coli]|nr:hypothetical protein [Escherichia coli]